MNLLKSGVTHALCTKIFLKKQGGIPPGGAEPICSAEDISVCSLINHPSGEIRTDIFMELTQLQPAIFALRRAKFAPQAKLACAS